MPVRHPHQRFPGFVAEPARYHSASGRPATADAPQDAARGCSGWMTATLHRPPAPSASSTWSTDSRRSPALAHLSAPPRPQLDTIARFWQSALDAAGPALDAETVVLPAAELRLTQTSVDGGAPRVRDAPRSAGACPRNQAGAVAASPHRDTVAPRARQVRAGLHLRSRGCPHRQRPVARDGLGARLRLVPVASCARHRLAICSVRSRLRLSDLPGWTAADRRHPCVSWPAAVSACPRGAQRTARTRAPPTASRDTRGSCWRAPSRRGALPR